MKTFFVVLLLCFVSACGVASQMPEVQTIKDDFEGATIHTTTLNQLRNVNPSGNVAELNVGATQKKGDSSWIWIARIRLSRQAGWPQLKGVRVKISDTEMLAIEKCAKDDVKASSAGYGHINHLESLICEINRETAEKLSKATGAAVRFDAANGADATLDQINTNAIKDVLNRVDGVAPATLKQP